MKRRSYEEETRLSKDEVFAFLNNAQLALADDKISIDRIDHLAAYACNLEQTLTKYSPLTSDELAFVLVSAAFSVKFPEGKP